MRDKLSPHAIDEQGAVKLRPGVAWGLARLEGLLQPVLRVLWVDEVRRMNPVLRDDVPDVQGHLFGRDRVSLDRPLVALRKEFGGECFYCNKRRAVEVDHVLPWSRSRIDGLANLVQVCRECNGDKRDSLPALQHIDNVLDRSEAVLDQIAKAITWTTDYKEFRSVARGLYLSTPERSQLWLAVDDLTPLDLTHPPEWMLLSTDD
jgi:5-methylcytosine-specific restriction endonuclease McrA